MIPTSPACWQLDLDSSIFISCYCLCLKFSLIYAKKPNHSSYIPKLHFRLINMTSRMSTVIETPLPDNVLEEIVPKAKDYALMHGAGMRSRTSFSPDGLIIAPFALLPSTFPRKEFEKAVNIQTVLNVLVHKVAHSYSFLKETLEK